MLRIGEEGDAGMELRIEDDVWIHLVSKKWLRLRCLEMVFFFCVCVIFRKKYISKWAGGIDCEVGWRKSCYLVSAQLAKPSPL